MHITQITLNGFRSYKNETIVGPFGPGANVVVGRNGSGKSNFFAAIRFVLSDAYTHLSREERLGLLHDGSGGVVMSAYVEIVFDNSDQRFPVPGASGAPGAPVVIRRTVGLKKDEYTLDRKSTTRTEIMSMLESAGFSKSNPYYIVPQGRITALTNSRDTERLALLKEVAGTKVYEDRRTESVKIMHETAGKLAKIDEHLISIDERLHELEQERQELKEYHKHSREKRCLDYTLLDREMTAVVSELEDLEEDRAGLIESLDQRSTVRAQLDDKISQLEFKLEELTSSKRLIELEKSQNSSDLDELIKAKARLELRLGQTDNEQGNEKNQSNDTEEIEQIGHEISTRQAMLSDVILPQLAQLELEQAEVLSKVESLSALQSRIQLKQGQFSRFSTSQERDKWLESEIADIKSTLTARRANLNQLTSDVQNVTIQHDETTAAVAPLRDELELEYKQLSQLQAKLASLEASRDELMDDRKELWKQESKIQLALDHSKQTTERAHKSTWDSTPRDLSVGLETVKSIVARLGLEQSVFGVIGELISVSSKYKLAAEVVAGTSLYHLVVDTDETASIIINELKRSSGYITIMPLNRLLQQQQEIKYPENDSNVIPLISKIRYDPKFEPAIRQVFGKSLLCIDLERGRQYVRTFRLNAITLRGDKLESKGVVMGGYHNASKRSRLDAIKFLGESRKLVVQQEAALADIGREIRAKDQAITEILSQMTKASTEIQRVQDRVADQRQSLKSHTELEIQLKEMVQSRQAIVRETELDIKNLQDQLDAYTKEIKAPFVQTLSDSELSELASIKSQLPQLKRKLQQVSLSQSDMREKRELVETEINERMLRVDQLKSQIGEREKGSQEPEEKTVELLQRSLNSKIAAIAQLNGALGEIEQSLGKLRQDVTRIEAELSVAREDRDNLQAVINREKMKNETKMSQRSLLNKRKEELQAKIRDLGVLPEEAFTTYAKMKQEELLKRLKRANENLAKYQHVNKRASDQFDNFNRDRDSLLERRKDLDRSQHAITELIDTLDQRKDEAIERTFRQVSKGFAEIFHKLVPSGKGKLAIRRRTSEDEDDEDDEDDDVQQDPNQVENYVGVSIKVSFNSQYDEQQRIEQLSGGQRSLCALALIFAIQQCDPAPFYLFDEIDANLDTQYRSAVANVIQQLSSSAQFICTTFRPEMLHVADKFFGVYYDDKSSSVAVIDKATAEEFIQQKVLDT